MITMHIIGKDDVNKAKTRQLNKEPFIIKERELKGVSNLSSAFIAGLPP